MKYTLCPDEIFVQTVAWNSPFKEHLFHLDDANIGNMRLIDWKRGHPYVWHKDDLQELKQSDKLFARKFSSQNIAILNEIEKEYTK
ncbi:glycosyl transferase family protein [gut metagenome]|uniref:Glycosyl transferase family protein n=1 Tax=gut metagenome TaxID=749906 RepID=J9GI85_9ZZZZ